MEMKIGEVREFNSVKIKCVEYTWEEGSCSRCVFVCEGGGCNRTLKRALGIGSCDELVRETEDCVMFIEVKK